MTARYGLGLTPTPIDLLTPLVTFHDKEDLMVKKIATVAALALTLLVGGVTTSASLSPANAIPPRCC